MVGKASVVKDEFDVGGGGVIYFYYFISFTKLY